MAHHTGYRAKLIVYRDGYHIARTLSIALCPTQGDRDDLLKWPFASGYSIAVVDQREDGKYISRAIDPSKLDAGVRRYWFQKPPQHSGKHTNSYYHLVNEEVMLNLNIPHPVLLTGNYVENGVVVIIVQVDN